MKYGLIILAILIASGNVYSQGMTNGYIGLFADDIHASWCVQGVEFYQIEMWVWCLPNDEGIICVDSEDFTVNFPSA